MHLQVKTATVPQASGNDSARTKGAFSSPGCQQSCQGGVADQPVHVKQRTAPLWAAQLAWAIVRDDLKGHTLAYSGGTVRQRQGSASAGAMLGEVTRQALL
ncbi:uncharacterized protein LOC144172779 [Haemaphysalis longicornis]